MFSQENAFVTLFVLYIVAAMVFGGCVVGGLWACVEAFW